MTSVDPLVAHLVEARKKAGLSQAKVAGTVGFSCATSGRLSEYETGRRQPSLATLRRWAQVLGFEPTWVPLAYETAPAGPVVGAGFCLWLPDCPNEATRTLDEGGQSVPCCDTCAATEVPGDSVVEAVAQRLRDGLPGVDVYVNTITEGGLNSPPDAPASAPVSFYGAGSDVAHVASEDPTGRALWCSCGSWSMLYRNSFGLDVHEAHASHATAVARTLDVAERTVEKAREARR